MNEELATRQQIKKLYAVVRNSGLDPRTHVRKILEENGLYSLNWVSKAKMSELIDMYEEKEREKEEEKRKESVLEEMVARVGEAEREREEEEEKKKLSKEEKDSLSEIDALFDECLSRATEQVKKLAKMDRYQASQILQVARVYFETLRIDKYRKERERGERREG